jgi:hypothetical protein
MELVMKSTTAALFLTILIAATFAQPAAASQRRHAWLGQNTGTPDYTQSGPNHTGPSFRGYPLSDWYIY